MTGSAGDARAMVERPVRAGTAALIPDSARPNGWSLLVNGVRQSYVDLDDPVYLKLAYTTWAGEMLRRLWPPGRAIDAVHVGGGAATLPRFVAATRPGSTQTVVDFDELLVDLVRAHLRLDDVPGLSVEVCDGRVAVANLSPESADLVLVDVFQGGSTPPGFISAEFFSDVARALREDGTYMANVWDGGELEVLRRVVAFASEQFTQLRVIARPGALLKVRPGNFLVVAGNDKDLPPASELDDWAGALSPKANCLNARALATVLATATSAANGQQHTYTIPATPPLWFGSHA